jgi:hypothetical protein
MEDIDGHPECIHGVEGAKYGFKSYRFQQCRYLKVDSNCNCTYISFAGFSTKQNFMK